MTARRIARRLGFWLSVLVIVSPAAFVFLWMLSLSLKNELLKSTTSTAPARRCGVNGVAPR